MIEQSAARMVFPLANGKKPMGNFSQPFWIQENQDEIGIHLLRYDATL